MVGWIEVIGLWCLPAFLALDLVYRARLFDRPRWWRLRALLTTMVVAALGMVVPALWSSVFGTRSLVDGTALGTWAGALVGILVYELAHYGYHRAVHASDLLFRVHQMHHSAESVDAFGAYYLHPLDAALFSTLASLVFFPLLGLSPEAGVVAGAFLALNAVFQHANIRTPRWLGYIVQRPESHTIHHARGVHAHNYSDLPLWDIVFGTFKNPETVDGVKAGYADGDSSRLAEMLALRDVCTATVPIRSAYPTAPANHSKAAPWASTSAVASLSGSRPPPASAPARR